MSVHLASSLQLLPLHGARHVDVLVVEVVAALRSHGVALLSNFDGVASDASDWSVDDRLAELAARLGTIVQQSPRGELIEDVRDVSDIEDRDDRGYRSGGELLPHSDPPTLIMLYSVTAAEKGGESYLVKVSDIYDAIKGEDAMYVETLHGRFPMWRVDGQGGGSNYRARFVRQVRTR